MVKLYFIKLKNNKEVKWGGGSTIKDIVDTTLSSITHFSVLCLVIEFSEFQ